MVTAGRTGVGVQGMGLLVLLAGCAHEAKSLVSGEVEAARRQREAVIRDVQREAAALRSDMAATRIEAAKKEAELQELRARVDEFAQALEAGQGELETLRAERDQLIQTKGDLQAQLAELRGWSDTTAHAKAGSAGPASSDKAAPSAQARLKELESAVARLSAELAEMKKISKSRQAELSQRSSRSGTADSGQAREADAFVGAVWSSLEEGSATTITVQLGDSLWVLAKHYGITVDQLKAANGLTGDQIRVGQRLVVPTSSKREAQPIDPRPPLSESGR